jgi:SAM-dependent methyltransferase
MKPILRRLRDRFAQNDPNIKYQVELAFWQSRLEIDSGQFYNSHYQRLMLAIAEEATSSFVEGKIIADFGCGPRGSLVWASDAQLRIGIDVLADRYADEFTDNITSHGMIYVKSTEKVIPLPSAFIDVMFTINAIDHVYDFPRMCTEILRILKPGGELIGSFNLEEPPTFDEPQQLNEIVIKENLLKHLEVRSYRITEQGRHEEDDGIYAPFFREDLSYRPGQLGVLWIRARKPQNPK